MNTNCKFFLVLLLFIQTGFAGRLGIAAGVYDFTDPVSKEFYQIAPMVTISYETKSNRRFRFVSQLSFANRTIPYNGSRHELFMGELTLLARYTFLSEKKSNWLPYVGFGLNGMGKYDENEWFEDGQYSASYGYTMLWGVERRVTEHFLIHSEVVRQLQVPPSIEDLSMSGIETKLGVKWEFHRSCVTK